MGIESKKVAPFYESEGIAEKPLHPDLRLVTDVVEEEEPEIPKKVGILNRVRGVLGKIFNPPEEDLAIFGYLYVERAVRNAILLGKDEELARMRAVCSISGKGFTKNVPQKKQRSQKE